MKTYIDELTPGSILFSNNYVCAIMYITEIFDNDEGIGTASLYTMYSKTSFISSHMYWHKNYSYFEYQLYRQEWKTHLAEQYNAPICTVPGQIFFSGFYVYFTLYEGETDVYQSLKYITIHKRLSRRTIAFSFAKLYVRSTIYYMTENTVFT